MGLSEEFEQHLKQKQRSTKLARFFELHPETKEFIDTVRQRNYSMRSATRFLRDRYDNVPSDSVFREYIQSSNGTDTGSS